MVDKNGIQVDYIDSYANCFPRTRMANTKEEYDALVERIMKDRKGEYDWLKQYVII